MPNIKMYGTSSCGDCIRAKQFFKDKKVEYDYISIENNEEATKTAISLNNGVRRIPVIQFADGTVLVEPTNEQLRFQLVK
jgi:mycoredoxin